MSEEKEVAQLATKTDGLFSSSIFTNPATLAELAASPAFAKLDSMEAMPFNISTQYFDFQLGRDERFVFLGITQRAAQDTAEEMPAVVLLDKDKNSFVNMGMILVSCFIEQRIAPGTPVQIKWIGTKKTQNGGQVRLWDVRPLIVQI